MNAIGSYLLLFVIPFAVTALTDYLKSLSPSALDMELRMLQVIDDLDEQESERRPELHHIELLLDYFVHETSCRNNFEFIQAVIRLFLKVSSCLLRYFLLRCIILMSIHVGNSKF